MFQRVHLFVRQVLISVKPQMRFKQDYLSAQLDIGGIRARTYVFNQDCGIVVTAVLKVQIAFRQAKARRRIDLAVGDYFQQSR